MRGFSVTLYDVTGNHTYGVVILNLSKVMALHCAVIDILLICISLLFQLPPSATYHMSKIRSAKGKWSSLVENLKIPPT